MQQSKLGKPRSFAADLGGQTSGGSVVRREVLVLHAAGVPVTMEAPRIPLGPAEDVKAALADVFGEGTWQDSGEGLFDGPGFSLLAKLSIFPLVETMTLEIWGEGDPFGHVATLCATRRWQAFELGSGRQVAPQ
jgi:hypothetical protein